MNWGAQNNNFNGINNTMQDQRHQMNHQNHWNGNGNANNLNMYNPYHNPSRNPAAGSPLNNAKAGFGGLNNKYPDYRSRYKNDILGRNADAPKAFDPQFNRAQNFNNNGFGMHNLGASPNRMGAVGAINGGYQNEGARGQPLTDRRNMEQMMPNRNGNFSERYRGIFGDYPQNGYAGLNNNNNGFGAENNFPGRNTAANKSGLAGSHLGSQADLHGFNRQNNMMRRTLPSVGNARDNFGQQMRISGTELGGLGGAGAAGNNGAFNRFNNRGLDTTFGPQHGGREKRFSHEASAVGRNAGFGRGAANNFNNGNQAGYLMPGQYNENEFGRPNSAPRNNRFGHFGNLNSGANRIGGSAVRGAAGLGARGGAGNQGGLNYNNLSGVYDRRLENDANHLNGSPITQQRGAGIIDRTYDRIQSPGRANLNQQQNLGQIGRLAGNKSPVRRIGETHSPRRSPGRATVDYGNLNNHMSPGRANQNLQGNRSPGRVLEDYNARIVEEVNPVNRLQISPSRMRNQGISSPVRGNREAIGAAAGYLGSPNRNRQLNVNNDMASPRHPIGTNPNFSPRNLRNLGNNDLKTNFEGRRLDGLSPRRNIQTDLIGSPSRRADYSNNQAFGHIRPARTQSIENFNDIRENNYPIDHTNEANGGIRRSPIVVHKGGRYPLQESNLNKGRADHRIMSPKKFDASPSFGNEKMIGGFTNNSRIREQDNNTLRRVTRVNNFTEKTDFIQEPTIQKMDQGRPYQASPAKPTITLRADAPADPNRNVSAFDNNFSNYRERYGNIVGKAAPSSTKYTGRIVDQRNIASINQPRTKIVSSGLPPKQASAAPVGTDFGPGNDDHVPKLNYIPQADDVIFGYDVPEPPTIDIKGGNPASFQKPPIDNGAGPVAPPYNPLAGNTNAGPVAPPYNPMGTDNTTCTNNADYMPEEEMFTYGYDDPEEISSAKQISTQRTQSRSTGLPPKWTNGRGGVTIRDDASARKKLGANNKFINKKAPAFRPQVAHQASTNGYSHVNPYANEDKTRISNVSNISASRDWSSRHAFQPPEVINKRKDMFAKKYNYGGHKSQNIKTFLEYMFSGEYKKGNVSPVFRQYMMASREELKICEDARKELLNKPISIEKIRLPNDYSSKNLFFLT